jgi:hypothetical protein
MEEDILLLEEMKNNCLTKREYIDPKAERKAQAIENLINKNKELEKIIELMNEYILKEYISPEICSKHTPEDCYADIYDDEACKKCILDYFRKKAKGE